jgi:hypothetical protein
MADVVDSKVVFSGKRYYIVHRTNQSDGTGESAQIVVDISTLFNPAGKTATYTTVDRIEYNVNGMNYVTLHWDHDTNDELAVLAGQGVIDATAYGGMTDPRTTGGTGDIIITTDGHADGDSYDLVLYVRPKAD